MSIVPVTPNLPAIKNFWDKKEGKFGKWFLFGAGALALTGIWIALPAILAFLTGIVEAGLLSIALVAIGVVLFALYALLTNPTFKCIVSNFFQMSMRKLASCVIEIDPIGVLKNNLELMKETKLKLDQGAENSAGAKTRLERKIEEHKRAIQTDKSKVAEVERQIASNRDPIKATTLSLNKQKILQDAGRRMQSMERLNRVLATATKCYTIMTRWQQLADFNIENTEGQVSLLKDERDTIVKAYEGMSIAQRLIKGDPEELKLVNATIEYLAEDNANKLGAIEDFSRYSEKLLSNMDVEQGAMASDAEQMLAQFEQKLLTAGSTEQGIGIPTNQAQPVPVLRQGAAADSYSQFFKP